MRKGIFFVYGVACYALFLAVYAWMAAFVGDLGFGWVTTLASVPTEPLGKALAINLLLIAVFGVQHSVMARPGFKRRWTRIIPEPIERSTYVLASCLALMLLLWQWRAMGGVVWDVKQPVARWALHVFFAVGWLAVPGVSLLINHFDLFGLRQVWLNLVGRDYKHVSWREPSVYRYIRHPLYVGWLIAFWATPTMTAAHLVFAVLMSAYILIAIPLEERDLVAHFGEKYLDYRRRVGGLMPRLGNVTKGGVRVDVSALVDGGWWSWMLMLALLVTSFVAGAREPIVAGACICVALGGIDVLRRGSAGAMSVQIRLGYAVLLLVGLLPGVHWLHGVQVVGTSLRLITGYCLLHRGLLLAPWNAPVRVTLTYAFEALTAPPGRGGLLRFGSCGIDSGCCTAGDLDDTEKNPEGVDPVVSCVV